MIVKFLRVAFPIALIINLAIIWMLTAQDSESSAQLSQKVVVSIETDVLKPNWDSPIAPFLNALNSVGARRWAHFVEYLPLGFFACGTLFVLAVLSDKRRIAISALFCLCCSILDQVHKCFVPGREFDLFDCAFDAGGYVLGIVLFAAIALIVRKFVVRQEKAK